MSLIDELRDLGKTFPPSHSPSHGEVLGVVGALIAYIEHGPHLLTDVEREYLTVAKFLGGVVDEPTPTAPEPVAANHPDALAELQLQNAELQQQLAAAVAVMNRTTVGEVTSESDHPASVELHGNGVTAPVIKAVG